MRPILSIIILVVVLAGCAPTSPSYNPPCPAAQPARSVTQTAPVDAPTAGSANSCSMCMTASLEHITCGAGELRGVGIGKTIEEAFNQASTDISRQINSSIKFQSERVREQLMSEGKESLKSVWNDQFMLTTELRNAQDIKRKDIKHFVEQEQVGVVACMSYADAAKPYKQSQASDLDSIEFTTLSGLKATHPKQKNEARQRVNRLWARMLANQELLKGWGLESDISQAKDFREAVEENYIGYCQTAKLHWSQEVENSYSAMAFSKFSQELKIERSSCRGSGILLVYKNAEPVCEFQGINKCAIQPVLSIAACNGTEYMSLPGTRIETIHSKKEVALEKLQSRIRDERFWNNWVYEIKQWRPLCD